MLLSRLLTQPDEFARFAADYQRQARGISIQPDYLQRAQVRVFYQLFRPQVYLAGFVVNAEAPYRYFAAPGEAAKQQALAANNLREPDLVEVGAIWFSRYASWLRPIHRIQFYGQMMYDAWLTKQPVILGGSFIDRVQGQQRAVLSTTIFQDVVTVGSYTGTLELYVGSRTGLWPRLVQALITDLRRRQRRSVTTPIPQRHLYENGPRIDRMLRNAD